MILFEEQISRIKQKLQKAKEIDKGLKVFGAKSHKYELGKPISEEKLQQLEQKYKISFPDCFRSFLLYIGNGGEKQFAGAAPFYGLYPVEKCIKESKEGFYFPCVIYPKMSDENWDKIVAKLDDENISDEDYDKEVGKIFGSLLTFGTQGCTYDTAIVLEGKHRGRVVNIDIDFQKPHFAFEKNFLDWYERWLDEIISGEILYQSNGFSYQMGGSAEELLSIFENSSDKEEKTDALLGLRHKKPPLPTEILNKIENYTQKEDFYFQYFVTILCISDFERAKKYFSQLAEHNLLRFFQNIVWYSQNKKKDSRDLLPIIREKLPNITDEEIFRFCGHVLRETDLDYGEWIAPFTENKDYKIRSDAFYTLGQLKNKEKYLDIFIKGLYDEKSFVVMTDLQALNGIKNEALLPHYKQVATRFPEENEEEHYVYNNLNHRLKEFGLSVEEILKMDF
ncbi:SMI1/KNR4 family protein [Capnocytophaga cynodegmi]|uniref:SMI1/KNR4 family protein n=1 Tax=Capnocytophaga cynodegmi TaxID=28189 RepID=UPI00385ECE45